MICKTAILLIALTTLFPFLMFVIPSWAQGGASPSDVVKTENKQQDDIVSSLLKILEKTDSPLIALCIIIFILNIKYGFLDKFLKGDKLGDNPHVSIATFEKYKTDQDAKLAKIIEKQGYHSIDIKLQTNQINTLQSINDRSMTLIAETKEVLEDVKEVLLEIIVNHDINHPNCKIETKSKL